MIRVDDFGAVGDGITDDSAAIASAFSSGGADECVEFSSGRSYKVGSPAVPEAGQSLIGNQSTIIVPDGVIPAFDVINNGTMIKDFNFVGPDTSGSPVEALGDSRPVRVSGDHNIISTCKVWGHFFGGIIVNGSNNLIYGNFLHGVRHWTGVDHRGAILINGGKNNIISNNRLVEMFDAGICIQASDSHEIINNTIECSDEDGAAGTMGIYLLNGTSHCVISGNRISNAQNEGIVISTGGYGAPAQFNSILGNVIDGCHYAGIVLTARNAAIGEPSHNEDNIIQGNTILMRADAAYGIRINQEDTTDHCRYHTVSGNVITGALRGIQCMGESVSVIGNQVRNCELHGIAVPGAHHQCSGNMISECSTGIQVNESRNTLVSGNTVRNSQAASVHVGSVKWVTIIDNQVDQKIDQSSAFGQRVVMNNSIDGVKRTDVATLSNGVVNVIAGALNEQYVDGLITLERVSVNGEAGAIYISGINLSKNQITIKSTSSNDNGIVRWHVIS